MILCKPPYNKKRLHPPEPAPFQTGGRMERRESLTDEKILKMAEQYDKLDDIAKRQIDLQAAAIALYKAEKEQEDGRKAENDN